MPLPESKLVTQYFRTKISRAFAFLFGMVIAAVCIGFFLGQFNSKEAIHRAKTMAETEVQNQRCEARTDDLQSQLILSNQQYRNFHDTATALIHSQENEITAANKLAGYYEIRYKHLRREVSDLREEVSPYRSVAAYSELYELYHDKIKMPEPE